MKNYKYTISSKILLAWLAICLVLGIVFAHVSLLHGDNFNWQILYTSSAFGMMPGWIVVLFGTSNKKRN